MLHLKRLTSVVLVAGALFVAPLSVGQAHAAVPYGETIIGTGAQSQEVVLLQADLRVLGYFTYPTNTGYYGEVTENAVKAFQRDWGLAINGKVGLTTGPAIQEAAAQKRAELAANGGQAPEAPTQTATLLETAKQYLGVPYAWGGRTPNGFDCSGFVGFVMNQYGYSLPRTAADIFAAGTWVEAPKPGDLVFFSTYGPGATHVGIYLGENQFISATTSNGVHIDSFGSSYWGPRYVGARAYN